jgi:tRNA U34 5-carboxymethylaminomethyl modifying GTPase MnmE/TrmE
LGVKALIQKIEETRKGRNVYIVGCVNAGKTSFLNAAARTLGIGGIRVSNLHQ